MSRISIDQHFQWIGLRADKDFRIASAACKAIDLIGTQPKSILDIGCGHGVFVLFAHLQGHSVLGIDISEKNVELARSLLSSRGIPKYLVKHVPLDIIIAEGLTFDLCVLLDVLEHESSPGKFLQEVKKILNYRGKLVLSVPAIPDFYDERNGISGHFLRYDPKTLIQHLEKGGFKVEKYQFWNFLGYIKRSLKKNKPDYYDFRYSQSLDARVMNRLLLHYFLLIENRVKPPVGLTLFSVASPKN